MMRRVIEVLLLISYGWHVWLTSMAHEPWRDEAQAWLYARDAGFAELMADLKFEAHPALWYLVLMPFAKAGASFEVMRLLHFAIVMGTAVLFIWRAPLSLWFKALALFSFYFFWQYAIEMRLYAIGLLLMFLTAHWYPTRFERPWRHAITCFLLSNANVHMLLCGAVLAGGYALELLARRDREPRRWYALGLMVIGVLLCLWQVGLIGGGTTHRYVYNMKEVHKFIVGGFFVGVGPMEALLPAATAILLVALWPLVGRPLPLLMAIGVLLANFVIALYKGSGLRHYGMVPMTLFWAYWLAKSGPDLTLPAFLPDFRWPDALKRLPLAEALLAVPLAVSLPAGWHMHGLDRRLDFSGTAKMAQFLKEKGLERQTIAIHRYWHLSSLPLYLPGVQFWNVALDRKVTFVRQDFATIEAHAMPYEAAIRRAMERVPPPAPLYVMLDVQADLSRAGFDLIYKVDETVFGSDERCFLYRRR